MKFRRSFFFPLVTLIALAVALWGALVLQSILTVLITILMWMNITFLGVTFIRMNYFLISLNRTGDREKEVLLTFDDGPEEKTTGEILDILKKNGIKAVFFAVGAKAERNRELMRRIQDEGHEIGCHTQNHYWYTNFMPRKRLDREISTSCRKLTEICGRKPRLFRPPIGLTNPILYGVLKKNGLVSVGWSLKSFDTGGTIPKKFYTHLGNIKKGTIILFHDGHENSGHTPALLEETISLLKQRGFRFVSPDFFDPLF